MEFSPLLFQGQEVQQDFATPGQAFGRYLFTHPNERGQHPRRKEQPAAGWLWPLPPPMRRLSNAIAGKAAGASAYLARDRGQSKQQDRLAIKRAAKEELVERWHRALDDEHALRIQQPETVTDAQREGSGFVVRSTVGAGGLVARHTGQVAVGLARANQESMQRMPVAEPQEAEAEHSKGRRAFVDTAEVS